MPGIANLIRQGWSPPTRNCERELYVRDPINHTIDEFRLGKRCSVDRRPTQFISLGGLNYENRRFNRTHGMAEFNDITHAYRSRRHMSRNGGAEYRLRSSEITQYAEDAILHHELNPFRCGKWFHLDFSNYCISTTPSAFSSSTEFRD